MTDERFPFRAAQAPLRATVHELRRQDGAMLAWLQARPSYCDRGRWHQGIEVPIHRSEADPWPRYYFDLECAKSETMAYLIAKKVDVEGAKWIAIHHLVHGEAL